MTPSNLEVLAYEDSALGTICLRRRELLSDPGTIVTENPSRGPSSVTLFGSAETKLQYLQRARPGVSMVPRAGYALR